MFKRWFKNMILNNILKFWYHKSQYEYPSEKFSFFTFKPKLYSIIINILLLNQDAI